LAFSAVVRGHLGGGLANVDATGAERGCAPYNGGGWHPRCLQRCEDLQRSIAAEIDRLLESMRDLSAQAAMAQV
jgi:hypothetical protein